MSGRCLILFLALGVALEAAEPARILPRSVTGSRQFVVYCDDLPMRLAVGTFVEETKEFVLQLLGVRDEWAHPIVITMRKPATDHGGAPPSDVRMLDVPAGLKIELDVMLGGDLTEADFPEQVVRAILLEMVYRSRAQFSAASGYREPPAWLVEGISAELPSRGQRDLFVEASRGALNSERLPGLGEFLALSTRNMDTTSRIFYRTCSVALLRLLAGLPGGKQSLLAYVRGIPEAGPDQLAEFAKHFPVLDGSEKVREKWWALGVARLSAMDRYRGLTVAETEARLDAIVGEKLPPVSDPPELSSLEDEMRLLARDRERRMDLDRVRVELLGLYAEAHPLLRPVVLELQEVVTGLMGGRPRGAASRLLDIWEVRTGVQERVEAIADYMNWFEATQPTVRTGAFDGYLKAARQTRTLESPTMSGRSPIADYLDRFQAELDRVQ